MPFIQPLAGIHTKYMLVQFSRTVVIMINPAIARISILPSVKNIRTNPLAKITKQSLHLLLRYKKPPILPQILDNGVPDFSEAFNNMKPDSVIDKLHALKFDLNTILSG